MHDPRTSTALRNLAELTATPAAPCWSWTTARLDSKGRLRLPRGALDALGAGPLRHRWHRLAMVLEPGPTWTLRPDDRGRVLVPASLRRERATFLIGIDAATPQVVVAPDSVLDTFGHVLAGSPR